MHHIIWSICQHGLTKGAFEIHCRKKHKSLKKHEWKSKFKTPDEYPLKDFEKAGAALLPPPSPEMSDILHIIFLNFKLF